MNYVASTDSDRAGMLKVIGADSFEELFSDIPQPLRSPDLDLPPAMGEADLMREMLALARRNAQMQDYTCFIGAGAYYHFVPSVVHHITGRSEFYTAYTPYQPEISQGTLQAIFEYQSVVCELTGMDVANASMYDGATATAEATILAQNVTRRNKVVVAPSVNPDYLSVLKTYTAEVGSRLVLDWDLEGCLRLGKVNAAKADEIVDGETACLLVQHPNFFGALEDVARLAEVAHQAGALFIVLVDPVSLGLLRTPGSYGADVVVGEGQSLGNPLSFGGPYLGLFAVKEAYLRQMPGRIVGQTVDHAGQTGYVLTLQTREQHIRREKAASNICSNEALNALASLVHTMALGGPGLRRVAELCLQKAHYAAGRIADIPGFSLACEAPFFKEFVIRCPKSPAELNAELLKHNIIGGYQLGKFHPQLADRMLLCVTEMHTKGEIDRLVGILRELA